jgi:Glyoxalase-like domain
MRLRQIALVARRLEPVVEDLCTVLGVQVGFRDPGVGAFGLENAVIPVGDTFLEVVSPVQEGTTAGRYLERRGGDGGYMVMVQSDDFAADRRRLDALGVRVVWSIELDDISGMHLHPRDVGGAILSLDEPRPRESWRWAGPEWTGRGRTIASPRLAAAELQSDEPAALARRWSEILGRQTGETERGSEIRLDPGLIRFVRPTDGRGDGLAGVDVEVSNRASILAAARTRGIPVGVDTLDIGGVRLRLV